MKAVKKPWEHDKVVAPTQKEASVKQVVASMVAKGECCVDNLCGCK